MNNRCYFLNYAKQDLNDTFEIYYGLTFGFYDLKQNQEKKIRDLSEIVKNEVFEKNGKYYKLFEKIAKVEEEIYDLEDEMKKDNKNFDIDKGMSVQIRDLYDDALREISRLMFMYGVSYGKSLERYLNEFPETLCKEKVFTRF